MDRIEAVESENNEGAMIGVATGGPSARLSRFMEMVEFVIAHEEARIRAAGGVIPHHD